jgi:hypothetical protein
MNTNMSKKCFYVFLDYLFCAIKNKYTFFAKSDIKNAYYELIVQNTHGRIKQTIILKLVTKRRKTLFTYGGVSGGNNRLRRILNKIKKDFEKNDLLKNNIDYIQSYSHGGSGNGYASVLNLDFSKRKNKILTNLEAKKIRCLINTLNNIPYPLTIEDKHMVNKLNLFPKDVLNLIVQY